MKIIHQITLPEEQDAEAFVEFMRDSYFPAVRKGPTRVGQVSGLVLLRGVTTTHERKTTFFMDVRYDGLASGDAIVDDEEIQRKFESFDAHIERLDAYYEVVVWPEAAAT